ncbi:MAG: citramalate synthase [Candidatus Methylacidiphilales bacterium]|nr:citramalate synthase [Candidatus Methylacidiphilales bacterium]
MKIPTVLYDTTLRDGAQAEGINLSASDKLRIAERLAAFGVHYIEGGFPGSNEKDIAFFREAAKRNWGSTRIAAFGSTRKPEMKVTDDPQMDLLLRAETPVVTFVGKSSRFQVTEVLRTTTDENLRMLADTTAHLQRHGREVMYDAEHFFDGYLLDPDYALACLRAASDAGASYVVLCDTNGGRLPHEIAAATAAACAAVSCRVAIHTHNDCGLGVANAVAALQAGASQVQGTINGYGERTGNCNLTTVIPILELKLARPVLPPGMLARLTEISQFVDEVANQNHDIRAPFVGQASFAHKGGMHANAVTKSGSSYEHIDPAQVGNQRRILVGELSSRSNIMLKAREFGVDLPDKSTEARLVLDRVKQMENEGYEFEAADASFELLVRRALDPGLSFFKAREYHVSMRKDAASDSSDCEATVRLEIAGEEFHTVAKGDGPVNALDNSLRRALAQKYPEIAGLHLIDYKVRIVNSSAGTAARIRVLVESSHEGREWGTVGVSDNVIEASWLALTDSFEYLLLRRGK